MTRDYMKPIPRQRLNALAPLDAPIIDFMMYHCPIRDNLSIALEDFHGQWWTACEWQHGGTMTRDTGDNMLSDDLIGHTSDMYGVVERLVFNTFNMIDCIGQKLPYKEYYIERCLAINYYGAHRNSNGEYGKIVAIMPHILRTPELYAKTRAEWEASFEVSYPRPEGAIKCSHEISVRAARMAHMLLCRRKITRQRKKEKRLMELGIT